MRPILRALEARGVPAHAYTGPSDDSLLVIHTVMGFLPLLP